MNHLRPIPLNGHSEANPYRHVVEVQRIEELIARHPQLSPPVIQGLLREREIGNITASAKTNKSWLAGHAGLCVVTGLPFLGHFEVSRGKVLLCDNELHEETLAHRIPTIANAMGLTIDDYAEGFDVIALRGKLRSLQEMGAVFASIQKGEYKLVILDAKYRFSAPGGDENSNSWVANEYNLLDSFADMLGSAFLIVHHSSKGAQGEKSITDVGSGAGSQSRAADTHMILRPHEDEGVAVFEAVVRSFAPVPPLALKWTFPLWTPDEWVDPSKLKGKQTRGEERLAGRDREGINLIVKALMDGPASARELRPKTSISKERLQRLLDKMQFDGAVETEKLEKRGNECTIYKLPPEDVGDE